MDTRRDFLKKMVIAGGIAGLGMDSYASVPARKPLKEARCTVYRACNGSPDGNLAKVIELLGGIERLVERDAVVVIKPNVQWWNQGAPNLLALKTFVEMIMDVRGGFTGEVVIAENCHRGQYPERSEASGWLPRFERNSDIAGVFNMNDLSGLLKQKYGRRFSTIHWLDVSCGGKRVSGPKDGTGYVYCDGTGGVPLLSCDNGLTGSAHRATIMTYPVFSTDAGTLVDLRNGVWEKGAYSGRPLRLVVFSALNHHSTYCGMTSAVKNYMGITDLSGGPDPNSNGRLTGTYYNFHSFPFDKWAPGPAAGMLGKAIGSFLRTVRKADLHITTAEWTGLASRTDLPAARTRAVLACTDPVALDYHAAKYLLYPNSGIKVHDPDDARRPLHEYLARCADEYGGCLDESHVGIKSYDLAKKGFQDDLGFAIAGERSWGSRPVPAMKYLYLRMMS